MNLSKWIIGFVIAVCIAVVFYPLYLPYLGGERRQAYRCIVGFHQAHHVPMRVSSITGQKTEPFLYLSWFSTGDPRHADEYLAYSDGMIYGRRVLWNYAVQGWGSPNQIPAKFCQLKNSPLLPAGIARAGDVPYRDLLIVSQKSNNVWYTNYYNRHHLPVSVSSMIQTAGTFGNVPYPDINANH